jgi:hypothetical protein
MGAVVFPSARTVKCSECENGWRKIQRNVEVRGVWFNAGYIELIVALPDAVFAATPLEERPAGFKFLGGVGCLMPLKGKPPFVSHHEDLGPIEKYEVPRG